MDEPGVPCASCPRVAAGLPMPCRGLAHRRFCVLVADGREDYAALLRSDAKPSVDPDRAAILARRARKLRVPLGVRPPQGRR